MYMFFKEANLTTHVYFDFSDAPRQSLNAVTISKLATRIDLNSMFRFAANF